MYDGPALFGAGGQRLVNTKPDCQYVANGMNGSYASDGITLMVLSKDRNGAPVAP
ncbi:MAG: hypothetical protein ACYDCL_23360 [Myxococcales bacterium]